MPASASESFCFCLFCFLSIFGLGMVYIQHTVAGPLGALPRSLHHFNACLVGGGRLRAPAPLCRDLFLTARAHFAARLPQPTTAPLPLGWGDSEWQVLYYSQNLQQN